MADEIYIHHRIIQMSDKCQHGADRDGHKNWPDGIAFTEPLFACSCCGTLFYTICFAHGPVVKKGPDGRLRGYWEGTCYEPEDHSLCENCGGRYVAFSETFTRSVEPQLPTLQERLAAYKAAKFMR